MASVTLEGPPRWCVEHAEQLATISKSLGNRKRSKPITPSSATLAKVDDAYALEIAREVWADVAPVTRLWRRAKLGQHSEAFKNAVEIATECGWIALRSGVGYVPGEVKPS